MMGTEDQLILFLTKLYINCQNKGRSSATHITINGKLIDLTCIFFIISETFITTISEKQWLSSDVNNAKHTIGHET
jgi:hypothetical protein